MGGGSSTTITLPIETENDDVAFWKLYDALNNEAPVNDDDDCIYFYFMLIFQAPSSSWGLPGVAAKHPSGFTKAKDRPIRMMISWLISQWSWTRSPGRTGTLIRPRDSA